MKIWTYTESHVGSPYWVHGVTPVCLIENDNKQCEWRRVADGAIVDTLTTDWHKARLLDPVYWPEWYRTMDDRYVDVGI